jgi:hypothetical protein
MSDRQRHLAGIEDRRRAEAARRPVETVAADLGLVPEDTSYNPYDNPGPAKPLRLEPDSRARRRVRERRYW